MSSFVLGPTINPKHIPPRFLSPAIAVVLLFPALGCTPPSSVLKAHEAILKESLRTMRGMIDQYAEDQRALPSSLDDLVKESYLREVPTDPITGKQDWNVDTGETLIGGASVRGIIDVHSNAPGKGSDGVSYRDY
jgi:general secretion pathway protein G